jgi:glycosyltransferase involved in cell wall biosynthesis
MKILFYNHTSQVSGAERVLLLILANLDRARFEPVLLSPKGELRNNASATGVHCENVNQLQARFTWRPQLLLQYLVSFISVIREMRARVRACNPELIHANSIRAGLVVSAATFGLRIPIIWHVHDVLPRHPLTTLIRLLVLLRPPARIVSVSQVGADRLRGKLLNWFGRRVSLTVVHNAVEAGAVARPSGRASPWLAVGSSPRSRAGYCPDEEDQELLGDRHSTSLRKQLRLRASDPLIGIVGNLSPVKGQLELITAFADVLKEVPEAALLIVGSTIFNQDERYRERLTAHAQSLGVSNRVRFLGQRNDVPAIMRSLDLLVLNSTTEACPLVVLEGFASGTPLLSTAVGGVPELIEHKANGWLVPPRDQKRLSSAITFLLRQPVLRSRLATNGRQHVAANFSVQKFMTRLDKIYKQCTMSDARVRAGSSHRADKQRMGSRIAVFHDNFAQMGGAEKVAEEIYGLLPGSTLHTTVAVPEVLSNGLRRAKIKTSWMQFLPALKRHFRHYFMFYPLAVESVDLSDYDLIVSSCFGYAKGVRKRRDAVHVCYCHTPMRWVWRYQDYSARAGFGRITRALLPLLLGALRRWDLRASRQPDYFVANSQVVAERIRKFYGREAAVIHPPIDVSRFQTTGDSSPEDYYLVLSRLVPYKRIDLAIEACTRLKRPLIVIGDGPDRARLEPLAGSNIRFLGRQDDEAVARYASRCQALIFPGEEDFGMTPLEVNAAGRPVIAFRAGGALETVVDGVTGVFFDEPNSTSLVQAIEEFELRSWDPTQLRAHAATFDRTVFAARLLEFLRAVAPGVELEANAVWEGYAPLPVGPIAESSPLPGLAVVQ